MFKPFFSLLWLFFSCVSGMLAQEITFENLKLHDEIEWKEISKRALVKKGYIEVDLGDIADNKEVTKEFVLHNKGQKTLHIQDVKTSCGCCVISTETGSSAVVSIPSGHKQKLVIHYDPTSKKGSIITSGTIISNAKNYTHVYVRIRANIIPAP